MTIDEIPAAAPDPNDSSISSNALESAGLGSMIIEETESESPEEDPWAMGPDDFENVPEVEVAEDVHVTIAATKISSSFKG